MEFLDEYESKPRFLLQSNQSTKPPDQNLNESRSSQFLSSLHKPTLVVSIPLSIIALVLTFLYFESEPFKSLLLWISMSLLLGPFAPISLTGGDISVGHGPHLVEALEESDTETTEQPVAKKTNRPVKKSPYEDAFVGKSDNGFSDKSVRSSGDGNEVQNESRVNKNVFLSRKESKFDNVWDESDEELLKKLMVKHPVGKPGRWEAIAEGLKGRYKPENVIAKAKDLGEKKADDRDSYQKFLRNRKVIDKRTLEDDNNNKVEVDIEHQNLEKETKGMDDNNNAWSSVEDLALLNALKAFPKDVSMRWEKIAASVPGKNKAACMKRVAELKKGFRSAKASSSSLMS